MNISEWAQRWKIPPQAIEELRQLPEATMGPATSEADTQNRLRLRANHFGGYLWRNNTGAFQDDTGRWVRYGLGNDSARINAQFKSSDLIGITPVEIAGHRLGIFTALEVKHPNWKGPVNDRERAQERFLLAVKAAGGIARFITHEGQFNGTI